MAMASGAHAAMTAADKAVPRYTHVIVIMEENKNYNQILNPAIAPNISGLAAAYGNATQFFGEVHPSEANYVALLGGDTFGIHDDDAFYCKPGATDPHCGGAAEPGYADHTVRASHLGEQLEKAGLTWKGYYESIPEPGSLAVTATSPDVDDGSRKTALYASKHSGFLNFASVQTDPHRAERLVGFDQWAADLAANRLPNFALVVPNQCNEMHGLHGPKVPADCDGANATALIGRGDRMIGKIVHDIQATPTWRSPENVAIAITFDEGAGRTREGCCAVTPNSSSNFGGGHIPTIIITNHGPKGAIDPTPYNHYSLLRTLEDAFGLPDHLAHAADVNAGVVPMTNLFTTSAKRPSVPGPKFPTPQR
jgi:hypothetical protein